LRGLEGEGQDEVLADKLSKLRGNQEVVEFLEKLWSEDQLTTIGDIKYRVVEYIRRDVLKNLSNLKPIIMREISLDGWEYWEAREKLDFYKFVCVRELRETHTHHDRFWEEQLREVDTLNHLNEDMSLKRLEAEEDLEIRVKTYPELRAGWIRPILNFNF
jgi:hypothetical protein